MDRGAFITGVAGLQLTDEEQRFLARARPFAAILFARNIAEPAQVKALCADIRSSIGDAQAIIFIDQEGGRVQRLRQPYWSQFAAARWFGDLYRLDPALGLEAVGLQSRLIGEDLIALGINGVCAPCLDISVPGAHDVIGDRAYSSDSHIVASLGRKSADAYLSSGVLPVIKHIPGHGRSLADSHLELPRVAATLDDLAACDFLPFVENADAPFAMTAHIVYEALDSKLPATLSAGLVRDVIRGRLGFTGALMSDDLAMKALSGRLDELAIACRRADVDLALHCNGKLDEMELVAAGAGWLDGVARVRCDRALARLMAPAVFDRKAAEDRLAELLTLIGGDKAYAAAENPTRRLAHA